MLGLGGSAKKSKRCWIQRLIGGRLVEGGQFNPFGTVCLTLVWLSGGAAEKVRGTKIKKKTQSGSEQFHLI